MSTSNITTKDTMIKQSDLEVTTHDKFYNNTNYHDSASHSVQKPKQEQELEIEESHSTKNIQDNISFPADGSQVSNINPPKVTEVSKGKNLIVNQPYIGHHIIFNNFMNNMFSIMHSFLKSGLGWGIIIIILTQCTAARAAPMQANDSLSLSPPGEMNQTSIPAAFSFQGVGATTIINGASTWFSKTYLISLGDVEDRLTKATSE